MNVKLRDAYEQYQSNGFILQEAVKNKKFSNNKGSLAERIDEAWSDKATGYVAIIPPTLIIVDNDSYKDTSVDMFAKLCKDLGLDYKPQPFALTPSGGEHYAFLSPNDDFVIGNIVDDYPNLDIYGGYQSVIPIVGTTALNKQEVLASYEWYDELDGFYINPVCYPMLEILKMRERGNSQGADFEESGLALARKEFDMPTSEVKELIEQIPDNFEYDAWLKVAIALYERYEGNDVGLEMLQAFGERCTREGVNNPTTTEDKWRSGHFKSDGRITGKTLRSLAREGSNAEFRTKISNAKTSKDLQRVTKEISEQQFHNTTSQKTEDVLNEYSELLNNQYKELKKTKPTVKVLQARTLRKELDYKMSIEEAEELAKEHGEIQVYVIGSKYRLRVGDQLSDELTKSAVTDNAIGKGIAKEVIKPYIDKLTTVGEVIKIPDYLSDKPVKYTVDRASELDKYNVLTVRTDPLYDVTDYIDDQAVIDDFCKDIWNGKAEDLMRLVGLSIRFNETKLNKVALVAPSDTGKTHICKHIDFQIVTMSRLLGGLTGNKGVGTGVVEGIKASGLMLLDEVNKALPAEIKDIDDYMYLDQFGQGGTQKIKLHYTVMTSTHKTSIRTMSDEFYNRLLHIELTEAEVKHTIKNSPLFQADSNHYTDVVQSYLRWVVKDCISNPNYNVKTLRALQAKYRLEATTDIDDLLYDVSERLVANLRGQASEHGDVLNWHDGYYIKRKTDLVGMIEDMMGENSQLDIGKYAEKLINHHLPNKERKKIKVNGVGINYYELNLKHYNPNADPIDVLRESYVNLDLEEF